MKKLIFGFIAGFLSASAIAYAAGIYGSGYLIGWEVTKDGEIVCDDPYVWTAGREIECD